MNDPGQVGKKEQNIDHGYSAFLRQHDLRLSTFFFKLGSQSLAQHGASKKPNADHATVVAGVLEVVINRSFLDNNRVFKTQPRRRA